MFSFFWRKRTEPLKTPETPSPATDDSFNDPSEIFELFTKITGMHFYKKEQITAEKLKNFCLRHQIVGFNELKKNLLSDPQTMQALIDYLTVNETYFFRELEQLEILQQRVAQTAAPVRILCAPCATGEEVYSIIIRLFEAGIPPERFSITGIDINASAIGRACEGVYSERSVNRVDEALRKKYFLKEPEGFRIIPALREQAQFRKENIFEEGFRTLGKFDVIFSRNLFIYFDETEKKRAVEIFCSLLKPEGQMFFGHADIFDDPVCLQSEFVGRTRVYTKKGQRAF